MVTTAFVGSAHIVASLPLWICCLRGRTGTHRHRLAVEEGISLVRPTTNVPTRLDFYCTLSMHQPENKQKHIHRVS